MAFPAFLIPLLIGAGVGAAADKEKPLRGAAIGGTLGALTGGLAGGAGAAGAGAGGTTAATGTAGAGTAATTAGSAASGATTAGGVAKAGEIGGLTLAQKAQIASSAQQSLTPQAQQALLAEIGKGSAAQGVQTYAGTQSANPLISSALNTGSGAAGGLTAQQLAQAQQGIAMMTPEEQQQQQQVAPVPLPQSRFEPFTPEEQMSRVGGNEPLFVPRGLFEEERQKMAFDYIDNNMDDLLYEELRMRGLA